MSRFTHPRTHNAGHSREAGQTLVLFVVILVGLLGVAGLAIDYGFWALNKNQVQSAADASALAGASQLPAGQASASSTASTQYLKNGDASDSVTVASYHQPHRQRLGHGQRVAYVPTWFTSVFGIHSVTVKGAARATSSRSRPSTG